LEDLQGRLGTFKMTPSINMPYFSLYFDLSLVLAFHMLLYFCGFPQTPELMHLCANT